MQNNYLPSKIFIKKIALVAVLLILIFAVSKLWPAVKNFSNKNKNGNVIVRDIIEKDSNNNGIADWEETLWGLDPTKDGDSNKAYIVNKKKTSGSNVANADGLSENDLLSRELLALVVSLKQTNNLNEDSLNLIGDTVAKQIDVTPEADIYTKKDVKSIMTTISSIKTYRSELDKTNLLYTDKDLGGEIPLISQTIDNKDTQALKILLDTGKSYVDFSHDLMNITVPTSLVENHVLLANSYNKTGKAILNMKDIINDKLSGMRAIIQYKKSSEDLISTLQEIGTFFVHNGIIKS
jgi:hypothetical protein